MSNRRWGLLLLAVAMGSSLQASIFFEGFEDVSLLAGNGWTTVNNSTPGGTTTWFQGDNGILGPAPGGTPTSYVSATFNTAPPAGGAIDLWFLTPQMTLDNGDVFSFYARTEQGGDPFLDQLTVTYSTNGASSTVSDFSHPVQAYAPGTIPEAWTLVQFTLSGLGGPTNGRFGFRYQVDNTAIGDGDVIGLDSVDLSSAVPEPGTAYLLLSALAAGATIRRFRRTKHQNSTKIN